MFDITGLRLYIGENVMECNNIKLLAMDVDGTLTDGCIYCAQVGVKYLRHSMLRMAMQ